MIHAQDIQDKGLRLIIRIFTISALALYAGSFVEESRSAQRFVCDNGNAIEIESSKTNPCVARHYGLKIELKDTGSATRKLRPAIEPPAIETSVELPVRKPKKQRFVKPSKHIKN